MLTWIWYGCAHLNSEELDMAGKVDRKIIDLREGANFDPEYIKIVSVPLISIRPSLLIPLYEPPPLTFEYTHRLPTSDLPANQKVYTIACH